MPTVKPSAIASGTIVVVAVTVNPEDAKHAKKDWQRQDYHV